MADTPIDYEFVGETPNASPVEYEFVAPKAPDQGPPLPAWLGAKNTAEDILKSGVGGISRGAIGTAAGGIGSIERTVAQDLPTLARNVGYSLGQRMDLMSPAEAEAAKARPMYAGQTKEQEAGRSAPLSGLPTYKGITEDIQQGRAGYETIPFGSYKSTTSPGKVTAAAAEGAMQAVPGGMGTIAPRMIQGALAGAGAEIGSEASGGNPIWTIAGGLGMGAAGAGLGHLASNKDLLARKQIEKLIEDSARRGASPITPEQFRTALDNGVPLSIFHLLDPKARKAVAKYAGLSDDAEASVNTFNRDLQAAQGEGSARVQQFMQGHFGSNLSAPDITNAAQDVARAERDHVFALARANPASNAIPNSVIGKLLLDNELFQKAMTRANGNAAALTKFNMVPPSITSGTPSKWVQTPSGLVNKPGIPSQNISGNMNYWQEVKEQLDGMHSAAKTAGENKLATTINDLRDELKSSIGKVVPEYTSALSAARDSYLMQDATRAGYTFAKNPDQFKVSDIRRVAASYTTPEQKALFQQGVGSYLNDIAKTPNGVQTLAKKFSSDTTFQDRMRTALGNDSYHAMRGKILSEELFGNADAMRVASGATRSILPRGVGLGTVGLLGGATADVLSANPQIVNTLGSGAATGLAIATATAVGSKIFSIEQQRIAQRLVPMLASADPAEVAKASQILEKNWRAQSTINRLSEAMKNTAGATLGTAIKVGSSPTARVIQTDREQRASGGKVGHAHLVSRLMKLAEHAKKSSNKATEPLLNASDDHVVKALDVAQRAI